MGCCHGDVDAGDTAFSVDTSAITFGPGCLGEAGDVAAGLGLGRVALFDDLDGLVAGSAPQRRLLDNAPIEIDDGVLRELFSGAMQYW